jgi:hypothetical protein
MSSGWTRLEGTRRAPSKARGGLQERERLTLLLLLAAPVGVGIVVAAAAGAVAVGTALRLLSLIGLGLLGFLVASAGLAGLERLQRRNPGSQPGGRAAPAPMLLERTERRLELAVSFSADYEQLRRELRAIAEQRLRGRGLRFESETARELLGADAFQLLAEPGRADGFSVGVERARLERLLRTLEGV